MKYFYLGFILFLLNNIYFFSQNYFLFKFPIPLNNDKNNIEQQYFGIYYSENKDVYYVVDKEGISIYSSYYTYITKEQIRENSQYKVKNNYLFGVIKEDSLLCHFEDEKYYFKLNLKKDLLENGGVIRKINSDKYIVNAKEEEGFSPSVFSFRNNCLLVKHFSYTEDEQFLFVSKKEAINNEKIQTIILSPNDKEINLLIEKNFSDKELKYCK